MSKLLSLTTWLNKATTMHSMYLSLHSQLERPAENNGFRSHTVGWGTALRLQHELDRALMLKWPSVHSFVIPHALSFPFNSNTPAGETIGDSAEKRDTKLVFQKGFFMPPEQCVRWNWAWTMRKGPVFCCLHSLSSCAQALSDAICREYAHT